MKKNLFAISLALASLSLLPMNLFSQQTEDIPAELRNEALKVNMPAGDFLKEEIPYINYVRDRADADVYVIKTTQTTGSGGQEITYFVTGQNRYAGMSDTLHMYTSPDDTPDAVRRKEVQILQIGLMRYVAMTPLASYLQVSFNGQLPQTVPADGWDSWKFSVQANARFSGDKNTVANRRLEGMLNINRTTENFKLNITGQYQNYLSKYTYPGHTLKSDRTNKSLSGLFVKSLGEHFSVGGITAASGNDASNIKLAWTVMPAIEFDAFPYSQSTRRQFRFLYTAGYAHTRYVDTTIMGVIEDHFWQHQLSADMQLIEKWGNMYFNASFGQDLQSLSNYEASLGYSANIRIAKGLFFNISASINMYHSYYTFPDFGDPTLYLLLEDAELDYDYNCSFGLSYTFGSIYNNVVNPRFGN